MYEPTQKRKVFVLEKKTVQPAKRLPRSLVTFFATVQLLFGFNFGFAKVTDVKTKTATNFITILVGCLMATILSVSLRIQGWGVPWRTVYFLEYLLTFFILMAARYTLCEYLTDLLNISQLPVTDSKSIKVGLAVWVYTSLMFVVKMTTAFVYASIHENADGQGLILDTVIHIPMVALDIIPVANFIIFYITADRMKDLVVQLEQRANLQEIQTTYKEIADGFYKFRVIQDGIFVSEFFTESLKWMVLIWNHLKSMKSSNSWLVDACSGVWAVHITVQMCAPAVCAELVTARTERIKLILQERLLMETDDVINSEAMVRLLRYVSARPLVSAAWRLVPLDLRLPTAMLSMCVTYLIVIIQFTHLYD